MKRLTPYQEKLADEGHCMADTDGDCDWAGCPQLADWQSQCPRDKATRAVLDPDDEGRAGG